jgi:ACT domain-containing protein
MKRKICILFLSLMLFSLAMSTQVGAVENEDLDEKLDIVLGRLDDVVDFIALLELRVIALENSIGYNETATLRQDMDNLSSMLNNLNLTDLNEIDIRLEQIETFVGRINMRLGYPMSKPDATLYDDLSYILSLLTYEEDGIVLPILKNITGASNLKILALNQQSIYNQQNTSIAILTNTMDMHVDDIQNSARTLAQEIKDGQGGTYMVALLTLIVIMFLVSWKLYLKDKFFPDDGKNMRRPDDGGFGKPSCFGDPSEFNPGYNPNCSSCKWINKCKAVVLRGDVSDKSERGTIEAEKDADGNIRAIYDEGNPIDIPQCFGKEYDPQTNKDCQECAINELCAEQLSNNLQKRVNVPPMQQSYRVQTPPRRQVPARASVGTTFGEDILDAF